VLLLLADDNIGWRMDDLLQDLTLHSWLRRQPFGCRARSQKQNQDRRSSTQSDSNRQCVNRLANRRADP
jgi:hypothetical protein